MTGDLYITKNSPLLTITDTVASDLKLEIKQSGSTSNFISRGGTSSKGQFNFRITDGSTVTNALFINQQANVGIGTTSPSEKLEVNGNVKATRVISNTLRDTNNNGHLVTTITNASNTDTAVGNPATANSLSLNVKSSGNVTVPNGKVGIGTTSPGTINGVAFSSV